jgi:hypothetical protein
LVRVVEGDGPSDLDSESATKQTQGGLETVVGRRRNARYRIYSRGQNNRGQVGRHTASQPSR